MASAAYIDNIIFKDFETTRQENSFISDILGDHHIADINLTTGDSLLPS